jgi:hypothetical protein
MYEYEGFDFDIKSQVYSDLYLTDYQLSRGKPVNVNVNVCFLLVKCKIRDTGNATDTEKTGRSRNQGTGTGRAAIEPQHKNR